MNAIKVKNNSFNKDIRGWILKSNAAQALGITINYETISISILMISEALLMRISTFNFQVHVWKKWNINRN